MKDLRLLEKVRKQGKTNLTVDFEMHGCFIYCPPCIYYVCPRDYL